MPHTTRKASLATRKTSLTGCDTLTIELRRVWTDQVDNYGDDCPVCQLEDRTIEVGLYLPLACHATQLVNCCEPCAFQLPRDTAGLDCDRPVIIETAKD
jgi:hypothetical protein